MGVELNRIILCDIVRVLLFRDGARPDAELAGRAQPERVSLRQLAVCSWILFGTHYEEIVIARGFIGFRQPGPAKQLPVPAEVYVHIFARLLSVIVSAI